MVRIKFTARPRTPVISPKFTLMASKDATTVSTERRETSAEKSEESLVHVDGSDKKINLKAPATAKLPPTMANV
jgi:hypothetical protein